MTKQIDLTITADYLNPFASPANPKLCSELADYLLDEAGFQRELSLQISCPEQERARLQQAIANTFEQKSEQLRGDIGGQRLVGLTLLILAIALVLAATSLGVEGTIKVGLVTVTAWMMVWRTAEIFLLEIRSRRRELRKYQRIISAPRSFV